MIRASAIMRMPNWISASVRRADASGWMRTLRLDYWMRRTPWALARQYWNYGRGRARTVRKHRILPRLRQMAPALNLLLLIASLVIAGGGLAFGSLPALIAGLIWPAIYLGLAIGAGLAMAIRHRSPCGLLASVALPAMHLPWGAGFLTGMLKGYR